MTLTQAIAFSIQASMALMVFCVALHATFDDVLYLARKPGLLARSLLAMNVIMPAVAIGIALLFPDLSRPLRAALITLAVSPVPPILPGKELKAGGRSAYVVGLLAAAALVSIVFVPIAAYLIGRIFGREVVTSPATVAWIVGTSLLAPLLAGVAVRRLAPSLAAKIARPLSIFATVLLIVAFLPVLGRIWPAVAASIGNYTLLTIVVFVVVGLAVGHWLGGPDRDDRSVLALSTATRHPGVALAIAHGTPDVTGVLGVVLVCLIVGALVSSPYVKWVARARSSARAAA